MIDMIDTLIIIIIIIIIIDRHKKLISKNQIRF